MAAGALSFPKTTARSPLHVYRRRDDLRRVVRVERREEQRAAAAGEIDRLVRRRNIRGEIVNRPVLGAIALVGIAQAERDAADPAHTLHEVRIDVVARDRAE